MGKVLIVEDEFLVAMQLEDILADEGHDVVGTVSDCASLCNLSTAPDVALVDLNLRDGLTGPHIARLLAAQYGAKVVYVTANPAQIDRPAPTAVGFLSKPFSREAILSAIAFALSEDQANPRPRELTPLPKVA